MSAYIDAPAESSAVPPHSRSASLRARRARWVRPAYWGSLILAALVYCYGLGQNGNANSYYAAAVLSGTKSWSAMFYGSLDAGNFITVDKPPVALWLMETSCRILGFGSWQMLLPIAACGVASVAVLYSAVRRSFGTVAATVAAVVLALTPITVAINRDNNPDPVLVLLTVSAAWFCLEAIRRGTLRHLVISAVLVGFAFNTKMLQAYMVLPALFLAYLWAARGSWLVRVRNLLVAGVALIVSSGWWMVVVDSIKGHPFIGSSSDGTVWNLVIGYNGLERVLGANAGNVTGSGSGTGSGAAARFGGGGGAGGGGANFGGTSGAGRLFNDTLGGQISWLIPFAVIALVGALVLRGRRRRTDLQRASLLLWGMWLLTHYVVFSFSSGTFHPYYTTMLAPPIAALTGAGGTMLLRALRSPSRKPVWAAVLPLGIAVSAVWAVLLLRRSTSFAPWLWPLVVVLAIGGVVALLVARFGAGSVATAVRKRVLAVGAVAAALALVAGPAAYAADTVTAGAIQGTNPTAGPSSGDGFGGPGGGTRGGFPGGMRGGELPGGMGGFPGGTSSGSSAGQSGQSGQGGQSGQSGQGGFAGGFPGGTSEGTSGGAAPGGNAAAGVAGGATGADGAGGALPGGTAGTSGGLGDATGGDGRTRTGGFGGGGFGGGMGGTVSSALMSYLEKNQGSATWLVAVSSAQSAAEMILQSGKPVIAMGGFTGSDPAMTLAKMKSLIASGKLRYVLLGSSGMGGMGGPGGGDANSAATSYVKSTCTAVSASAYGGTSSSSSTASSTSSSTASSGQTLYECTG
ncbi:glycosyltransferase family 39 protein [Streptacidiphilus jiangxiensis]|uniref:4-amino-4-deoxy-L-arabinose transferase n=1 Tax=Streptacidiphilus jiangxiensis TaxID=235985 RepID=A0A1H7FD56_STRJI|nr:glycosyltransferase family 39 protein [Streptacidiphilus jiangxiensis]SEK22352.1 4-amino-4-deoxy-L-arabinose transferase [Streptacidiphilus jiangxiensis]